MNDGSSRWVPPEGKTSASSFHRGPSCREPAPELAQPRRVANCGCSLGGPVLGANDVSIRKGTHRHRPRNAAGRSGVRGCLFPSGRRFGDGTQRFRRKGRSRGRFPPLPRAFGDQDGRSARACHALAASIEITKKGTQRLSRWSSSAKRLPRAHRRGGAPGYRGRTLACEVGLHVRILALCLCADAGCAGRTLTLKQRN